MAPAPHALDPATAAPTASLLYDIQGAKAFHQGQIADAQQVGVQALDPLTLSVRLEGPMWTVPPILLAADQRMR